jgi:hypothetical protein
MPPHACHGQGVACEQVHQRISSACVCMARAHSGGERGRCARAAAPCVYEVDVLCVRKLAPHLRPQRRAHSPSLCAATPPFLTPALVWLTLSPQPFVL